MYSRPFTLQIPQDLWERLLSYCERGKISEFIRQAIKEKLNKEETSVDSPLEA